MRPVFNVVAKAAILVSLANVSANAFTPDSFRAVFTPGDSHKEITQSALDRICAEYGYTNTDNYST